MRWIAWLVPSQWRDTVLLDLEDEARDRGKSAWWVAGQMVRVALRLRPAVVGEALTSDVRYAFRSLMHARGFTVGAVLLFALAIGVNVAVFSAVDRLVFRPMPYADADRLFLLRQFDRTSGTAYGSMPALYVAEGRTRLTSVEAMTVVGDPAFYYPEIEPGDGLPFRLAPASANLLEVVGVAPVLGRGFAPDDVAARRPVVLLSHDVWKERFGGLPTVLGQSLWSNREPAEIIGVLPRGFFPPTPVADPLWAGLVLSVTDDSSVTSQTRASPQIVRLRPGVTLESANAELEAFASALASQLPPSPQGFALSLRLDGLRETMFGYYRDYIWLVFAACATILLIACANIAGLMVARGQARERETAVKAALGGSRARLVSGVLLESLLVSTAGCTTGLVAAAFMGGLIKAYLPPIFVGYGSGIVDLRVLLLSIALAVGVSLLAAIVPAWRLSRVDVQTTLQRSNARGGSRVHRSAAVLLAAEAALTVALVGAGVVSLRSFAKLAAQPLGYATEDLYGVRLQLPRSQDPIENYARARRGLEALRTAPGVTRVAGGDAFIWQRSMTEPISPAHPVGSRFRVTEDFFATTGMPLLAGRPFTAADVRTDAAVAVVNARGARVLFPDTPADQVVGQILTLPGEPARRVVAVVGDTRESHARLPRPALYLPMTADKFRFMFFEARSEPGRPLSLQAVRDHVRTQVGAEVVVTLSPVAAGYAEGLFNQRFRALLFGLLGVVGVVVAASGLYATVSFDASLRQRELGVRMALGGTRSDMMHLVVRRAIAPVAGGAAVGLVASWWGATLLQSFLFQVDAREPWTLAAAVFVVVGTAVVAAWIPAQRASRTDPALVMRVE